MRSLPSRSTAAYRPGAASKALCTLIKQYGVREVFIRPT